MINHEDIEDLNVDDDIELFKLEEDPIDTNKTVTKYKILSFDIEVYNADGMPNAEDDPIIMMSLSGNYGFNKVLSTKNQIKTLLKL